MNRELSGDRIKQAKAGKFDILEHAGLVSVKSQPPGTGQPSGLTDGEN